MRKTLVSILPAVVIVFCMAGFAYANCGICGVGKAQAAEVTDASMKGAVNVGNKVCPVSGDAVGDPANATVEYEGKSYNLCCPACVAPFKKDPAKYIEKVNEELAADPNVE